MASNELNRKKRILLVEDEALLAMAEKMSLTNRGYGVQVAATGEEALEIMDEEPGIDLILMDIDLGLGINGVETAKRILARFDIPVVFLSGHTEPEVVELTETITSYGYVVKNSGITILDASIKMAFKLHEANRLLNLEKEHLSTTLNSIGDAVIATDLKGNVTRMNPVAQVLTGWSLAEGLTRPITDVFTIFNATTGEVVPNPALRTIESGCVVGLANHTVLVSRTGERYQIADSGAPIKTQDGTISGAVLVFRDVTEEYRKQEALQKRIIAMTLPLDHPEGITFDDLFDPEVLQRIQDEFSTATGVASIITHPDGTPITRPSNFTRLCFGVIRCTEAGRHACFQSDALLGRYNPDGPTVQPCLSGGLWDAGASITVGDRHIANWLIGQIRDETQSEQKIRSYARSIGADEETAAQAFREVPTMSIERFRQVAQVVHTLANELSKIAWINVQQARFISERQKKEGKSS